jgi:hypothetical protein
MSRVGDLASKFAGDADLLVEEFQTLMTRLSELYRSREMPNAAEGGVNFSTWLELHFGVTDAMRTAFTVDLERFARAANQSRFKTTANMPEIDVDLFRRMAACIRGPWYPDIGHELLELRDQLWMHFHAMESAIDSMPRTPIANADSGQGTSHMTGDGSVGPESTDPFESLFAATQADSTRPKVGTSDVLPDGTSGSVSPSLQAAKISVNVMMVDIMQSVGNEECVGWSIDEWRKKIWGKFKIKPAKSTIHKQPAWGLIRKLRAQAQGEAVEHQTIQDQSGKRRSRVD